MILAKVISNVWATRKAEKLNGLKFLLVEELTGDESENRKKNNSCRYYRCWNRR